MTSGSKGAQGRALHTLYSGRLKKKCCTEHQTLLRKRRNARKAYFKALFICLLFASFSFVLFPQDLAMSEHRESRNLQEITRTIECSYTSCVDSGMSAKSKLWQTCSSTLCKLWFEEKEGGTQGSWLYIPRQKKFSVSGRHLSSARMGARERNRNKMLQYPPTSRDDTYFVSLILVLGSLYHPQCIPTPPIYVDRWSRGNVLIYL